jgi:UDP-glucose 6-dehydrogenase
VTRIAIIGTGYVGLTTGACFAHLGHEVVCADIDPDKVARLNRGEIPIVEHRLDELVTDGLRNGNLRFVLGAANAVADCEIAFLCVPTPQGDDGSADLSYVETAAAEIAPVLPYEAIVVNKSTVPVGSTKVVERVMKRPDVRVVSNPEFLREGSAVEDFLNPDRVVVGADDRAAAIAVGSLYDKVRAQIIVTDPASAETIKYAANAFLATKLSFINAIAAICEGVGADVNDVVVGMGYDKRIGTEFLRPGPGWGGSCFDGAETLLVRSHGAIRLVRFDQLVDLPLDDLEVLSWAEGQVIPEFQPAIAVTQRPYSGDMIELRTKMGRRLTITADHPMFTRSADGDVDVRPAGSLTTNDWLPISLGAPLGDTLHATSIWSASIEAKEQFVNQFAEGPTFRVTDRTEADTLFRLLGELGIVADGAEDDSDGMIITPRKSGYRVDRKGTAWVRIADLQRRHSDQLVYSVEVARNHSVVTTGGLVAHNCFPKDSRALLKIANEAGYRFDLLAGVITVNEEQLDRVADKIRAAAGDSLDGKTIAVWGLTFKARTDDLRDSPAVAIINRLLTDGVTIRAYDPTVTDMRPGVPAGITICADPYSAVEEADVLAVLTEWDEFRWIEARKVATAMRARRVVDGRNLLDRNDWQRAGFIHQGIGR